MFADLTAHDLKPSTTWENYLDNLSEFMFSNELKTELLAALEEEGENVACFYEHTVVVKRDKNYIFFPNQWFFLASLCKKYAKALEEYFVFFDDKIRPDAALLRVFEDSNNDFSALEDIISDEVDRERMIKFVRASDRFREGKKIINRDKNTHELKWRETKDVFGSIVLKMINVPDSSSNYLGILIYYLAKRPELYDRIENEINQQLLNRYIMGREKLPSKVKDCAKRIVDYIYEVDGFGRIKDLFSLSDNSIKIDTSSIDESKNLLRYMFILPSSEVYNNDERKKQRVFNDKIYTINIGKESYECKLTGEWSENVGNNAAGGNALKALIKIVNRFYSDVLEIKTERDDSYLCTGRNSESENRVFSMDNLPSAFDSVYARRYIRSLLAKPFVILTGNSGTGKTRIAKQFAEYLEVVDSDGEKNWLIVPVGADWTDNSKVLGFYNPLGENGTGRYEKTSILKLIERANSNPNIPYFLILDEMNLSYVERYFSDFLSHMETPDNPFELDGYNLSDENQKGTGKLQYPKNLFVTGTVNIDETTYMFSPKVLDRANVIEFKPEKDSILDVLSSHDENPEIETAGVGAAGGFIDLARKIKSDGTCLNDTQMEVVTDILGRIYTILETNGYEFGYRTVKEIKQYMCAAAKLADGNFNDDMLYQAIDEQVLQKILPKVHGNRKEIGAMLKNLGEICTNCNERSLDLSNKKISQMTEKLNAVQYASFI